jgi:hypothetical protein
MASCDVAEWAQVAKFEQFYRKSQDALRFVTRGELTFLWWKYLHANPGASAAELRFPYRHVLVVVPTRVVYRQRSRRSSHQLRQLG